MYYGPWALQLRGRGHEYLKYHSAWHLEKKALKNITTSAAYVAGAIGHVGLLEVVLVFRKCCRINDFKPNSEVREGIRIALFVGIVVAKTLAVQPLQILLGGPVDGEWV